MPKFHKKSSKPNHSNPKDKNHSNETPNKNLKLEKGGNNKHTPKSNEKQPYVPPRQDSPAPTYAGNKYSLSLLCRKLLKRDPITRVKAIAEIVEYLQKSDDKNDIPEFLPIFSYVMSKYSFDNNRNIRERLVDILFIFIDKARVDSTYYSYFETLLQECIGFWWQLMADPAKEVADLYKQAFDKAIPPNIQPGTLFSLAPPILKHLKQFLFISSKDLMEYSQSNEEEIVEMQERVLIANIEGLNRLFATLQPSHNLDLYRGIELQKDHLPVYDDNGEVIRLSYTEILTIDFFVTHLQANRNIRRAMSRLLSTVCGSPSTSKQIVAGLIEPNAKLFADTFVCCLDETYSIFLNDTLRVIVEIARKTPSSFWYSTLIVQEYYARLLPLKRTCPESFVDYFFPLLSTLPLNMVSVYASSDPIDVSDEGSEEKGTDNERESEDEHVADPSIALPCSMELAMNFVVELCPLYTDVTTLIKEVATMSSATLKNVILLLMSQIETLTFLFLRRPASGEFATDTPLIANVPWIERLSDCLAQSFTNAFYLLTLPITDSLMKSLLVKLKEALNRSISVFYQNMMKEETPGVEYRIHGYLTLTLLEDLLWTPLGRNMIAIYQTLMTPLDVSAMTEETVVSQVGKGIYYLDVLYRFLRELSSTSTSSMSTAPSTPNTVTPAISSGSSNGLRALLKTKPIRRYGLYRIARQLIEYILSEVSSTTTTAKEVTYVSPVAIATIHEDENTVTNQRRFSTGMNSTSNAATTNATNLLILGKSIVMCHALKRYTGLFAPSSGSSSNLITQQVTSDFLTFYSEEIFMNIDLTIPNWLPVLLNGIPSSLQKNASLRKSSFAAWNDYLSVLSTYQGYFFSSKRQSIVDVEALSTRFLTLLRRSIARQIEKTSSWHGLLGILTHDNLLQLIISTKEEGSDSMLVSIFPALASALLGIEESAHSVKSFIDALHVSITEPVEIQKEKRSIALTFLCTFSNSPTFYATGNELLSRCIHLLNSEDTLREAEQGKIPLLGWYILTLANQWLVSQSESNMSISHTLIEQRQSLVCDTLLEDSSNQLITLLLSAYFVHDISVVSNPKASSTKTGKPPIAPTTTTDLYNCIPILSWEQIEANFFFKLPTMIISTVLEEISRMLNSILHLPSKEWTASKSSMKSRKLGVMIKDAKHWSNHALHYLTLLQIQEDSKSSFTSNSISLPTELSELNVNTERVETVDIIEEQDMLDEEEVCLLFEASYWEELCICLLQFTGVSSVEEEEVISLAIHCLHESLYLEKQRDAQQTPLLNLVLHDVSLYLYIYMTLWLFSSVATSIRSEDMEIIHQLTEMLTVQSLPVLCVSEIQKCNFCDELISTSKEVIVHLHSMSIGLTTQQIKICSDILMELIDQCYMLFYNKVSRYQTLKPFHQITLRTPFPAILQCKGMTGYYLKNEINTAEKTITKIASHDDQVIAIQHGDYVLVPCTFQACHVDDGIDKPYYTITLHQGSNTSRKVKEIQTEWSRLIIGDMNASDHIPSMKFEVEYVDHPQDMARYTTWSPTHSHTSSLGKQDVGKWILAYIQDKVASWTSLFVSLYWQQEENRNTKKTLKDIHWHSLLCEVDIVSTLIVSILKEKDPPRILQQQIILPLQALLTFLTTHATIYLHNDCSHQVMQFIQKVQWILIQPMNDAFGCYFLLPMIKNIYYNVMTSMIHSTTSRLVMNTKEQLGRMLDLMSYWVTIMKQYDWEMIQSFVCTTLVPKFFAYLSANEEEIGLTACWTTTPTVASIAASEIPPKKFFSDDQRLQLIMILQSTWCSMATKKGTPPTDDVVEIQTWEYMALDCLLAWYVRPTSVSTSPSLVTQLRLDHEISIALHYALLYRNRSDIIEIVTQTKLSCCIPYLLDMALSSSSSSTPSTNQVLTTSLQNKQLTALKYVDMWYGTEIAWKSKTKALSLVLDTAGKKDEDADDEDELCGDADETEEGTTDTNKDAKVFHAVVGEVIHTEIIHRLTRKALLAEYQSQQHAKAAAEAAEEAALLDGEEDMSEDETFDSDIPLHRTNSTVSVSSKYESANTLSVEMLQDHLPSTLTLTTMEKQFLAKVKKHLWRVLFAASSGSPVTTFTLWISVLQCIDTLSTQYHPALRAYCGHYLHDQGIFPVCLQYCIQVMAMGEVSKCKEINHLLTRMGYYKNTINTISSLNTAVTSVTSWCSPTTLLYPVPPTSLSYQHISLPHLALFALYRTVETFPAMTRAYWTNSPSRQEKSILQKFIAEHMRALIIKREIQLITTANTTAATGTTAGTSVTGTDTGIGSRKGWDPELFEMKGNPQSGEIRAILHHDETQVELLMKLPPAYPLYNVEVSCSSRIGIKEGSWQRWVLQMIRLLSNEDGTILDAALLWKENVEKELDGVEACPICYCVLHAKNQRLPSLACGTCHHKFHPACLQTWFKQSGKNVCVLCQQPMFSQHAQHK